MIPGETVYAPRGIPPMTLVVVTMGKEQVHENLDPNWNVLVYTGDVAGGWTFISNLRVGNVISHVPTQDPDTRFVIKQLDKRRGGNPRILVVAPEAEEKAAKMMRDADAPKFHWPRPAPMSVWERLRKPQV